MQDQKQREKEAKQKLIQFVQNETFEEFSKRTVQLYRNSRFSDDFLHAQLKPTILVANANNPNVKFCHSTSIKAVLEERKRFRETQEMERSKALANASAKNKRIKQEEVERVEEQDSSSEEWAIAAIFWGLWPEKKPKRFRWSNRE